MPDCGGSGGSDNGRDAGEKRTGRKQRDEKRTTAESLKRAGEALAALPGKTWISARAAVTQLRPEILDAQSRGYTLSEVREVLSEKGIPIALSTLRGYMRDPTPKERSGGARKKAARKGRSGGARGSASDKAGKRN